MIKMDFDDNGKVTGISYDVEELKQSPYAYESIGIYLLLDAILQELREINKKL